MLTLGRGLMHRSLPFIQAHSSFPGGVLGFAVVIAMLAAAFTEWIGIHAIFGAFLVGKSGNVESVQKEHSGLINKIYHPKESDYEEMLDIIEPEVEVDKAADVEVINVPVHRPTPTSDKYHFAEEIEEEETLSLKEKELELIKKALEKNHGRRKAAAEELGLSERTLYRKIKQYNL